MDILMKHYTSSSINASNQKLSGFSNKSKNGFLVAANTDVSIVKEEKKKYFYLRLKISDLTTKTIWRQIQRENRPTCVYVLQNMETQVKSYKLKDQAGHDWMRSM